MSLVFSREVGYRDRNDHQHPHLSTFSGAHALRLVEDEVLRGHGGCVNRLAWNEYGTRLASGSDDCRIILWRYPAGGHAPLGVSTEHAANIFGVDFLPCTGDRMLVSGAMDDTVQLHQLDGLQPPPPPAAPASDSPTTPRRQSRPGDPGVPFVQPLTTVYRCHTDRVKDVAVQAGDQHLFWSASEDGTVRQFDRRIRGQTEATSSNALLWLTEGGGRTVSCKGINISSARPHLLALACGDPWVRVFDRRRLGPVALPRARDQSQPLLKLCPPHLMPAATGTGRISRGGTDPYLAPRCHTTCASFSSRGDRLVATYYSDHAYIFDVTSTGSVHSTLPEPRHHTSSQSHSTEEKQALDHDEEEWEEEEAGPQELCSRIRQLSAQLARVSGTTVGSGWPRGGKPQLLVERARLLLERAWRGDAAWAVRDLEACLDDDFDHCEARRVLVDALAACNQPACAAEAAEDWLERFRGTPGGQEVQQQLQGLHRLLRQRQASLPEGQPSRTSDPEREAEQAESTQPARDDDSWGRACAMDAWWPFYHRSPPPAFEPAGPSASSSGNSGLLPLYHQRHGRGFSGPSTAAGRPLGRGSVWQDTEGGRRLVRRLVGQQNQHTDIKEAAFLGGADALVAAGSDDGYVYLYCVETGEPIVALEADEDVANCCKPHPHLPVIATSGIEDVVRLWAPAGTASTAPRRTSGRSLDQLVAANQEALQNGGSGHGFGAVLHSDLVRVVLQSLVGSGQTARQEGVGGQEGAQAQEGDEVELPCRVS